MRIYLSLLTLLVKIPTFLSLRFKLYYRIEIKCPDTLVHVQLHLEKLLHHASERHFLKSLLGHECT